MVEHRTFNSGVVGSSPTESSKFKSPPIHRTPMYRARAAFRNMMIRCRNKNGKNPAYENVRVKMTLNEWLNWAIPEYEKFQLSYPDLKPAASRKKDKGHYEIGNVEIISTVENKRRQSQKSQAVSWLKCPVCKVEFQRATRQVKHKISQGHNPCCSRKCGGVHGNKIRLEKGK